MDDKQPQKLTDSPIPDVQISQQQPEEPSKKPKVLYLVLILVVVLILILGALVGILLVRSNKESSSGSDNVENEETSDQEKDGVNVEEEEQTNEDTSGEGDESGQDTEEEFDMTELWPTYDNSTYKFRLKHPKDLIPNETNVDASTFEVEFKAGDLTAFTVQAKQGGTLDSNLQLLITNQCSQSATMSNASYGGYTYRKALDVPDEQCLTQLGVTRDTELASFGRDMGSSSYFMLRNDGLMTDQLEAVMGSIEYY
jgi:cytoskeletal protein RodZ